MGDCVFHADVICLLKSTRAEVGQRGKVPLERSSWSATSEGRTGSAKLPVTSQERSVLGERGEVDDHMLSGDTGIWKQDCYLETLPDNIV